MWGRSHFTIDTAFFQRVLEQYLGDANLDFSFLPFFQSLHRYNYIPTVETPPLIQDQGNASIKAFYFGGFRRPGFNSDSDCPKNDWL